VLSLCSAAREERLRQQIQMLGDVAMALQAAEALAGEADEARRHSSQMEAQLSAVSLDLHRAVATLTHVVRDSSYWSHSSRMSL
jgi:hypothetical protein